MKKIKTKPTNKWIIANAITISLALIIALYTHSSSWIVGTAALFIIILFVINNNIFHQLQPFGGYPNLITLFRFLLIVITNYYSTELANIQLFLLFGFAVFLDGLDGWTAMKLHQKSELGALFDMETDAFFVLILSFILVEKMGISPLFLIIGWLHYGYEIIIFSANWQNIKTPKNPIGRYAAFVLFMSLLTPFISPSAIYNPILFFASFLTFVSFGISFFYKITNLPPYP